LYDLVIISIIIVGVILVYLLWKSYTEYSKGNKIANERNKVH